MHNFILLFLMRNNFNLIIKIRMCCSGALNYNSRKIIKDTAKLYIKKLLENKVVCKK